MPIYTEGCAKKLPKDQSVDEVALDIAADVDAQRDLYLVNTCKLEGLQNFEFSKVQLPVEWFEE